MDAAKLPLSLAINLQDQHARALGHCPASVFVFVDVLIAMLLLRCVSPKLAFFELIENRWAFSGRRRIPE
jgi:hypothetical protein